jgi:hypothetical protein
MITALEYPAEIAERAVDFDSDELGPAVVHAGALLPWQNAGQNYAACQTSHATSIFQVDTPRGQMNTGMLRHFYKCPTAGTEKGSELLTEPLYPVILGGRLTLTGIVLLTQTEAMQIGAFESAMRAR